MKFRNLELKDEELFNRVITKSNIGWEYDFATLYTWNAKRYYADSRKRRLFLLVQSVRW